VHISFPKRISLFVLLFVFAVSFYSCSSKDEMPGLCPQTLGTIPAPDEYLLMKNVVEPTEENILTGNNLYNSTAKPIPCIICHGIKGDGIGLIFQHIKPYPRNFTCYRTMKGISDGQLFWTIKNGSHGTQMPSFTKLEDEQIWKLILYIRRMTG